MRLFLVRHGETVDNVASVYAGITDSPLTNHGILQANRLGLHLATTGVKISHIFSSDLVRAFKTAEAVRLAQPKLLHEEIPVAPETVTLAGLREQDFGSLEGKAVFERSRDSSKSSRETFRDAHKNDADFKDVESKESMKARSHAFIDQYLLELFTVVPSDCSVVVVAHGIILVYLWRSILKRFAPAAVSIAADVVSSDRAISLERLGMWSNTGYLELEIAAAASTERVPTAQGSMTSVPRDTIENKATAAETNMPKLLDLSLVVKAVNSLEHLKGLKKTRGGIGSSKHDEGQKTIESFFKKRKIG